MTAAHKTMPAVVAISSFFLFFRLHRSLRLAVFSVFSERVSIYSLACLLSSDIAVSLLPAATKSNAFSKYLLPVSLISIICRFTPLTKHISTFTNTYDLILDKYLKLYSLISVSCKKLYCSLYRILRIAPIGISTRIAIIVH